MKLKTKYSEDDFISEIAKRALFTKGDVGLIIKTFKQVIKDIILEDESLTLTELFILRVKRVKARNGWDGFRKQYTEMPEAKKIVFQASSMLTKQLNKKEEKIK